MVSRRRGRKSASVGVSALAQGEQAPAACGPACLLPAAVLRGNARLWVIIDDDFSPCTCQRPSASTRRMCFSAETPPSRIAAAAQRLTRVRLSCLYPLQVGNRGIHPHSTSPSGLWRGRCPSPPISPSVPQEAHLRAAADPSVPRH